MSLADDIKKGMFAAMKAKSIVEKEILRVAMGEITTAGSRAEKDELPDSEVQAILKKLIKSNREALEVSSDASTSETLNEEIRILTAYLPKSLSVDEIVGRLAAVKDQIAAAANQGPAMGLAMKTLKAAGVEVDAKDVAQAVAQIRA